MINSIDPTNLLSFCAQTTIWAHDMPDTVLDELVSVKHTLDTFCTNNDDPLYEGVMVLCDSMIDRVIDVLTTPPVEPEVEEPKEEIEEVTENGINSRSD